MLCHPTTYLSLLSSPKHCSVLNIFKVDLALSRLLLPPNCLSFFPNNQKQDSEYNQEKTASFVSSADLCFRSGSSLHNTNEHWYSCLLPLTCGHRLTTLICAFVSSQEPSHENNCGGGGSWVDWCEPLRMRCHFV